MKNTFLKFWKNPVQLIYMVMLLLVLIGGINVLSASFVTARDMTGDGLSFFKKYSAEYSPCAASISSPFA